MRTAFVCLSLFAATAHAFDLELGLDGISQAVALGQSASEPRRAEFHRPYRLIVSQPPLDYIDVITPFRRVVLGAEARLLAGERLFGQRDALNTLGDRPEQVDLRLELTFHPLNTFIGVPNYAVDLISVRDRRSVERRAIELVPRFGPRVNGQPLPSPTQGVGIARGPSQPLLGGTIVVLFDGRLLDRTGSYEVTVSDGVKMLSRSPVDFAALR